MKRLLSGLALLVLASCGNNSDRKMTLKLQPTPHPLVDNLFIAKPRSSGGLSSMGGAVGQFSLVGRCLVVRTDNVPRTPVFRGDAAITRSGITTAGREIPYGSEVRLPRIGPPMRISGEHGKGCPEEAVIIRSIGG